MVAAPLAARRPAVGAQPSAAQHRVVTLAAPADAAGRLPGIKTAALKADAALQRPFGALGHDIDHAADGGTAPQHALRAAQHFEALDFQIEQIVEIKRPAVRIVDFHSVDQHQGLIGFRAAQIDLGQRAEIAAAADRDSRRIAQRIGDAAYLALFQLVGGDDSDGATGLFRRNRNAGGGDHQLRQILLRDGGGQAGRQAEGDKGSKKA